MAARPSPAIRWCFTLNNPIIDELQLVDILNTIGVEYAVFQLEQGETPHFQGFMVLMSKQRMSALKEHLPTAHFEIARGTNEQNRTYCTKEETRIGNYCELGIFPERTPGKRTDLLGLQSALDLGLTQHEYSTGFFELFARHPDLLWRYLQARIVPRTAAEAPLCVLVRGAPGLGKTRLSHHLGFKLGDGSLYIKPSGKWFDGYVGQRCVLFDDFRGSCLSFGDFKRIIDRYPLHVEVKGSYCDLAATRFVISSNFDPQEWWNADVTGPELSAIFRRIDHVLLFIAENTFIHFASYDSYVQYSQQRVVAHGPFEIQWPTPIQVSYPEDEAPIFEPPFDLFPQA